MMMQCPRCSTRWRVAAAAPAENPLFKCGKCHHLFRQFPGATPARESPRAATKRTSPAAPAASDTLEFIFPERQPAELLVADDPVPVAPTAPRQPIAAPGTPPPLRAAAPPLSERTVVASETTTVSVEVPPSVSIMQAPGGETVMAEAAQDAGSDEEPTVEAVHVPLAGEVLDEPAADDETTFGDREDEDEMDRDGGQPFAAAGDGHRLRVEETMRAPAGLGTILRAIGTAVTGFAALALVIRVAPERTSAWLARLPLAGATFAHDRNLASKVELTNVQGHYQRLRSLRRVFVITGNARNDSPMTIERIEVSGVLYGLGGGELDQKIVTTGNRTTLTDLSEAEIVLLQRLDPVIALAPGESTPFSIVFLEPPRELREFSSKVLSVRPTRRASRPPAGSSRDSVG